jgi:hypothetical protein
MTKQLIFLDTAHGWRLDAATRERGRKGVADGRAVLKAARAQERAAAEVDPLSEAA